MHAKFETAGVYQPDSLIAGNAHLLVGRQVTIATGQNLKRGALLGKITAANSATSAIAGSSNVGQASVGSVTVTDPRALDGTYTIEITQIKGAGAAEFEVTGPAGATEVGTAGVVFEGLGVKFTLTEGGIGNEAALGDSWTFVVTAANGEYVLSASGANDGSQTPDCILAQDADARGGDVQAMVYTRGDFDAGAITLGTGHTLAAVTEALRGKGITLLPTVA